MRSAHAYSPSRDARCVIPSGPSASCVSMHDILVLGIRKVPTRRVLLRVARHGCTWKWGGMWIRPHGRPHSSMVSRGKRVDRPRLCAWPSCYHGSPMPAAHAIPTRACVLLFYAVRCNNLCLVTALAGILLHIKSFPLARRRRHLERLVAAW